MAAAPAKSRAKAAAPAAPKGQTRVWAVVGSDESEVKRAAKTLSEQLTPPGAGDFAQEIIDGTAANADEASQCIHRTMDALLTFPFLGGEKLVWLKNANFLSDTQTGRAASVLEALEKLQELMAAGIPEGTRFLLSASEPDKRRSFYKSLAKVAKVEVFDKLDPNKSGWEEEAAVLVRQLAAELNVSFEPAALELFCLFTGGDRRAIGNELEKLALYQGPEGGKISEDTVRVLVPMSRTGVVWELGTALSERNVQRALALLEQLLFQGESAIGIMYAAIIPTVRSLLLVKDLMDRHKLSRPGQPFFFGKTLERLPPEAIAHLPRKKDGTVNTFALGAAAMHAGRFTLPELHAALEACLTANAQLVTSSLDPKVVLSLLITRIAGKR